MFWMNGMGPRGPIHGHRGFNGRPGMGCRRPMGFPVTGMIGLGLGGLFLLPALIFAGWVIVAVTGALLGGVIMILGGLFSGLGEVAASLFSGITSAGSIVIGIIIGLALFRKIRSRNESRTEETEEV